MSSSPVEIESALKEILEKFQCQAGTVHSLTEGEPLLRLVASIGIPAPVVGIIQNVPVGKGMAGLAAERNEPVQVCNLQTDDSGRARPGARATGMEGSIAIPMRREGQVAGVLGVAKSSAYEFTASELENLLGEGEKLAGLLS